MVYPTPLVTTIWLEAHLQDPNVRIIDIRGRVLPPSDPLPHYYSHREAYQEAHLPGAVFVDWIRDITVNGPTQMQVAPPERIAALMGKLGIGPKTFVVVYDDAQSMFAARLWWVLNYYGHSQVAVLDGGWDKWIAEDRAITSEIPYMRAATFTPKITPSLRWTADDVQLKTDTTLIDVRTTGEYQGLVSRAKRSGHIPGAIHLPRSTLVTQDGLMPPSEVLQDIFEAAGADGQQPTVLLRIAGISDGAIYDGSWKDWGNDDSRPIEK
ncbi:MAG: sulfurtransferase [Anaerolineae bacterium]|nr:sulfurtransferase [Anaerolineae bacterium]